MSRLSASAVLLILLAAAPAARAQTRVAIVGLEGLGIDSSVVRPFQKLLEETVADVTGGGIITPTEIAAKLTTPSLARLQDCQGDADCLADLGGVLDAPFVLWGNLTQLGDNFVISLRLLDLHSGEIRRGKKQLSGERDLLIQTLREAVTGLLDPEKLKGSLQIVCNVSCPNAIVDGKKVSVTAAPVELAAGQHTITVEVPGYRTVSSLVEVRLGEMTRLEIELKSGIVAVAGQASQLWPWLSAGVGGLGLATGGTLAYLTELEEQAVIDAYNTGDKGEPWFKSHDRQGRAYALWTNVALAAGTTLVAAAVVGWLWPDDLVRGEAP